MGSLPCALALIQYRECPLEVFDLQGRLYYLAILNRIEVCAGNRICSQERPIFIGIFHRPIKQRAEVFDVMPDRRIFYVAPFVMFNEIFDADFLDRSDRRLRLEERQYMGVKIQA